MAGGIDGLALGSVAVGSLFLFAAIQGKSITGTLQALVKGQSPSSSPPANQIPIATEIANAASSAAGSVTLGGASPVTGGGSAQQVLQQTAAQFGWGSGAQWQALSNVEMEEAGFNPQARNPRSGALGLAQALGHGTSSTAGTLGNEYGGFGLTDAQAKAANSGDAAAQALWMCNYIKATYGNPVNAWSHEQSHHWY